MYARSKRFPELFLRGRIWWAFLPAPRTGGERPRESTGHTDELAAHRWYLDKVRAGLGSAVETTPKKDRTLLAALDERIQWLKSARSSDDPTRKKLAEPTIDFYEKKGLPLLELLGKTTTLTSIGAKEIRRYIVERSESVKGTSIAKELTTLSMAWEMAKKDGIELPAFEDLIPADFAAIYVPKTRWLPENEVEAFCTVLNPKRVPLFLYLVSTGSTYPSEVEKVRPGFVQGYVVHIPGTKATGRDRYVHVPSYARKLFKRALAGLKPSGFEPWSNIRGDLHDGARLLSMCNDCRAQSIAWARHEIGATKPPKDKCQACVKTPEVMGCSPNDLRRTFCQWLVRSGVPYELAAAMVGHSTTKMLQQVYGKRDAGAVAKLVEMALKKAPKGARLAG